MALCTWSILRFVQRRCLHQSIALLLTEGDRPEDHFQRLSRRSFWKEKYSGQSEAFDWFLNPEEMSEFVVEKIDEYHSGHSQDPVRILDLGCGTSGLPARILQQTPHPVEYHCLDFVAEAVVFQRKHCENAEKGNGLSRCLGTVGNVMDLPYQESRFHVLVDKGTMDALLKDRTNWKAWSCRMAAECHRVLIPQGHFLQVSDEDPEFRGPLLEEAFRACDPGAVVTFKVHGSRNGLEYFSYHYRKS